jgi:hypothetical protein
VPAGGLTVDLGDQEVAGSRTVLEVKPMPAVLPLAVERSENAYARLVRGLVTPAGCWRRRSSSPAAARPPSPSQWRRSSHCSSRLTGHALSCGWRRWPSAGSRSALGVAIGAAAREVSAASLLAFLVSLPIAFVALVPANAVSGTLKTVLDAIAFVFPFKAALQAITNAFTGGPPAIGLPLVHLAVLALLFGALARLTLRRFATR